MICPGGHTVNLTYVQENGCPGPGRCQGRTGSGLRILFPVRKQKNFKNTVFSSDPHLCTAHAKFRPENDLEDAFHFILGVQKGGFKCRT